MGVDRRKSYPQPPHCNKPASRIHYNQRWQARSVSATQHGIEKVRCATASWLNDSPALAIGFRSQTLAGTL